VVQSFNDESIGFMLGLRSSNVLLQSLNESNREWININSEENIGTTIDLAIINH